MKKKKQQENPDAESLAPILYPADEDIYNKAKKIKDEAPDGSEDAEWQDNKKDTESIGSDLDVPGAELDDPDEKIGEEDEENNYYSLGGEEHYDLEEGEGG